MYLFCIYLEKKKKLHITFFYAFLAFFFCMIAGTHNPLKTKIKFK